MALAELGQGWGVGTSLAHDGGDFFATLRRLDSNLRLSIACDGGDFIVTFLLFELNGGQGS